MVDSDSTADTYVELYVRSLLPRGTRSGQDGVIHRLDQLESAGAVDGISVRLWGRGIALEGEIAETDAWQSIYGRIATFLQWAAAADATIEPFVDRGNVRSHLTGEEYEAIRFPSLLLAVYRDDALAYVAPNADGETVRSIADVLDAIERDDDLLEDAPTVPGRPRPGPLSVGDTVS